MNEFQHFFFGKNGSTPTKENDDQNLLISYKINLNFSFPTHRFPLFCIENLISIKYTAITWVYFIHWKKDEESKNKKSRKRIDKPLQESHTHFALVAFYTARTQEAREVNNMKPIGD